MTYAQNVSEGSWSEWCSLSKKTWHRLWFVADYEDFKTKNVMTYFTSNDDVFFINSCSRFMALKRTKLYAWQWNGVRIRLVDKCSTSPETPLENIYAACTAIERQARWLITEEDRGVLDLEAFWDGDRAKSVAHMICRGHIEYTLLCCAKGDDESNVYCVHLDPIFLPKQ